MSTFASKHDTWVSLVGARYPNRSAEELVELRIDAASDWYMDKPTPLALLFEQYVMINTLTGGPNGN